MCGNAVLTSAYILCYLSVMWLQLQKIERSLKNVSVNNGMLLSGMVHTGGESPQDGLRDMQTC